MILAQMGGFLKIVHSIGKIFATFITGKLMQIAIIKRIY
jgi:hypothetical protein